MELDPKQEELGIDFYDPAENGTKLTKAERAARTETYSVLRDQLVTALNSLRTQSPWCSGYLYWQGVCFGCLRCLNALGINPYETKSWYQRVITVAHSKDKKIVEYERVRELARRRSEGKF